MSTTTEPCKHEIDELLAQLSNQHRCEHCGIALRTSVFPPSCGEQHKFGCPNSPQIDYVVGFLFDPHRAYVLLLQKRRPQWMSGMWNGPGGKLEPGESAAAAMRREFVEETGVDIPNWEQYAALSGAGFRVFFFRAFSTDIFRAKSMTDEIVDTFEVDELPGALLANATWLIPMALSMDEDKAAAFTVQEVAAAA